MKIEITLSDAELALLDRVATSSAMLVATHVGVRPWTGLEVARAIPPRVRTPSSMPARAKQRSRRHNGGGIMGPVTAR